MHYKRLWIQTYAGCKDISLVTATNSNKNHIQRKRRKDNNRSKTLKTNIHVWMGITAGIRTGYDNKHHYDLPPLHAHGHRTVTLQTAHKSATSHRQPVPKSATVWVTTVEHDSEVRNRWCPYQQLLGYRVLLPTMKSKTDGIHTHNCWGGSGAPSSKVTNHTHINNCLGWVLHPAEKLQTIPTSTIVWDECCTQQKSYKPYPHQQLFGMSGAPSRKVTNHTHINNCLGWVLHPAEKLQTIHILTTFGDECCT